MRLKPSTVALVAVFAAACSKPALPPEPPWVHGDLHNPSGIKQIEIDHLGCPLGPCPMYRVSINVDGHFEYEGRQFVGQIGRQTGEADRLHVHQLFRWLGDHPKLFSQSCTLPRHGADLEGLSYRFVPMEGEAIIVTTDIDFGEFWELSHLVDAIVLRAMIWETRGEESVAT